MFAMFLSDCMVTMCLSLAMMYGRTMSVLIVVCFYDAALDDPMFPDNPPMILLVLSINLCVLQYG